MNDYISSTRLTVVLEKSGIAYAVKFMPYDSLYMILLLSKTDQLVMSMLFAAFWIILRNGHLILELVSRWRTPQTSIAEMFC